MTDDLIKFEEFLKEDYQNYLLTQCEADLDDMEDSTRLDLFIYIINNANDYLLSEISLALDAEIDRRDYYNED